MNSGDWTPIPPPQPPPWPPPESPSDNKIGCLAPLLFLSGFVIVIFVTVGIYFFYGSLAAIVTCLVSLSLIVTIFGRYPYVSGIILSILYGGVTYTVANNGSMSPVHWTSVAWGAGITTIFLAAICLAKYGRPRR